MVEDLVELRLKARIGANLVRTFKKKVEGAVKMQLGSILITDVVLIQAGLVFLVDGRDQLSNRIRFAFGFRPCRRARLISGLSRCFALGRRLRFLSDDRFRRLDRFCWWRRSLRSRSVRGIWLLRSMAT